MRTIPLVAAICALALVVAPAAAAADSSTDRPPVPRWRITLAIDLGAGGDPGLSAAELDAFFDRALTAVARRRHVVRARRSTRAAPDRHQPRIVAIVTAPDRTTARAVAVRLLRAAFDAGATALPADAELGWSAATSVRRAPPRGPSHRRPGT